MKKTVSGNAGVAHAEEFTVILQKILRYANRGVARIEFLTEISNMLLESSQCDALELRVRSPDLYYRWEFTDEPIRSSRFTLLDNSSKTNLRADAIEKMCSVLIEGRCVRPKAPFLITNRGSIWTATASAVVPGRYTSIALMRFTVDDRTVGLLQLKSLRNNRLTERRVAFYEEIAQIVGMAIANRRAQWALRERVKELTCLYEIGRIAQQSAVPLEELLQRIVEVLPPAWQFPETVADVGKIVKASLHAREVIHKLLVFSR